MATANAYEASQTVRSPESANNDRRKLEKVRTIFTSLSKYINARTIYAANNPNVNKFASAFYDAFGAFFEDEKELLLTIEQYRIKWHDEVVYDNQQRTESIAFMLYKDGVGEIIFQSSVTSVELDQFVDLIRNEIYNPSAHLDIVSRMWQSEFTNISYRVLDEYSDGATGDGRGLGSESREEPLGGNDHPNMPNADDNHGANTAASDSSIVSLDKYIQSVVAHVHPHAAAHEKEKHVQDMLEFLFMTSTDELRSWRDQLAALNDRNKLLWLFTTMLDFTQKRSPPSVVRDVLDIIDRLVRYSVEEAHIPTLIALLDIQRKMADGPEVAIDFQALPERIGDELTNSAFLLSLGKCTDMSHSHVHDVLRYFQLIGRDAVPGVCELIANLKDRSTHKDACDTLIAIAGDDLMHIVDRLNLDNPHEAKDAIYLLRRTTTGEVPSIIKRLVSSPDLEVREQVIEYLARHGSDEAAQLLLKLLEDGDASVRIKTLAAVEEFGHPLIIDKVTALCFAEDLAIKGPDELERMFRTVGKLAGKNALAPIKQMSRKKTWLPFGKTRNKQNKLLAITALRYIQGEESLDILRELADDGDGLVRTKALYVLQQLKDTGDSPGEAEIPVGTKETA